MPNSLKAPYGYGYQHSVLAFSIRAKPPQCPPGRPTGEDGPPFALLLHPALLLPRHGEGHLEHEAPDVVALLEVRPAVHQLLLLQEGADVGHLDVGVLGVQVFGVNLGLERETKGTRRWDTW